MYEPKGDHVASLVFLWPAFAAAAMSDVAAHTARQFADLAIGPDERPAHEPRWATPNSVALDLKTVRLRDFSTEAAADTPVLLCAPLSAHNATIADFAPGHSLVMGLREAGLRRLFITDWRSATAGLRLHAIDDYLADLNVLVDEIGGPVDLVGLCQGGWMALVYAARFPAKVRKLVLAGAPIDLAAGSSSLSTLADISPLPLFHGLLRIGDGLVPGRKVMKFWAVERVAQEDIRDVLQIDANEWATAGHIRSLFDEWYAWTLDLPATYFLDVVEKLYKHNELAAGKFVALGKTIDLTAVRVPIFMLAARDDELVSPEQLFATERLVGTDSRNLRKATAPGHHVSLFMGQKTLKSVWPEIAHWLASAPGQLGYP